MPRVEERACSTWAPSMFYYYHFSGRLFVRQGPRARPTIILSRALCFFDMSIDLHVTVKVSASHLNGSISYYIVSTRTGQEATLFPFWIQLARVENLPGFATFSWDCLHYFWDGLCRQFEYSTRLRLSLHQRLEWKSRRHRK